MTKQTRKTRRLTSKLIAILLVVTAVFSMMPTKARAEVTSKMGNTSLDVSNGRAILVEGNSETEIAKPLTAKDAVFDNVGNIYVYLRSGTLKVGNTKIQKELVVLEKDVQSLIVTGKGESSRLTGYVTKESITKPALRSVEDVKKLIETGSTGSKPSGISIDGTNVIYTAENGVKYTISTGKIVDSYGKTVDNVDVIRFTDGSICYLPYSIQKELGKKIELIEFDKNSKELMFGKSGRVVGYYSITGEFKTLPTIFQIRELITATPTPTASPTPTPTPCVFVTPTPTASSSATPKPDVTATPRPSTPAKTIYADQIVPKGKKFILKNSNGEKVDYFIKHGTTVNYKGWKMKKVRSSYVQFNKAGNLVVPYNKTGKCIVINHKTGRKTVIRKKGIIKVTFDDDGFSKFAVSKAGKKYNVYKK